MSEHVGFETERRTGDDRPPGSVSAPAVPAAAADIAALCGLQSPGTHAACE